MPASKLKFLKRKPEQPHSLDSRGSGDAGTPVVEALEPRMLFSADPFGIGTVELPHLPDADRNDWQLALEDHNGPLEIVVIDAAVSDLQRLLADFNEQLDAGRNLQIHVLDSHRDGIAQVSEILRANGTVSAVHILSHGTSSGLQLGDTWLNQQALNEARTAVAQWQLTLTDDADLLLYGCNLASDPAGQALLDQLATLTDSNVAASDDITGHAAHNGNWNLEHQTGAIDTAIALSDQAQQDWLQELADFPIEVTTVADIEDGNTTSVQALIDDPGTDGEISLREAIAAANNEDGHDEIYLPDGTYERSGAGELTIDSDITLRGQSQAGTIIDAELKSRAIHIPGDHTVTFENLQLINGLHDTKGGAIEAHNNSIVTLNNVSLVNNVSGQRGGAVVSDGGSLDFNNVKAYGNSAAEGGAVELKDATFNARNSEFYNNSASDKGGAISGEESVQTYTNVTMYNNSARQAGAISNVGNGASLTLNNSTLSSNQASDDGGAIRTAQPVNINNSTIAFNEAGTDGNGAGGGLHFSGSGEVVISNSILSDNIAASSNTGNVNQSNKVTSLGNNIDSDGTAALSGAGDISNSSAQLAPLATAANGLSTHALLAGSPAIDAGNLATAESRDANGLLRSNDPDIGAVESGSAQIVGTPGSVNIDGFKEVLWNSKPEYIVNREIVSAGVNSGTSDISATWQASWNSDYLYFYVDVKDDVSVTAESATDRLFDDDSIEIYLDPDYSRGNSYDTIDDTQILFSRADATAQVIGIDRAAINIDQIQSAVNEYGTGYSLEIALPWSELGIVATQNATIGVEVHVNDDDDGGGRDTALQWADGGNTAYQRPAAFGTAELLAVADNAAPTYLHTGLELNLDAGNNQYLEAGGGFPDELSAVTLEATFSTSATGSILSIPVPGLGTPISIDLDDSVADGQIHTIGVTWDNITGNLTTYFDGVVSTATSFPFSIGTTVPQGSFLIVGQSYNGAGFNENQSFDGTLYDLRIWDTALTAAQIDHYSGYQLDSATLPDELIGYWQMRELSGADNDTIINVVNPGTNDLKLKSIAPSGSWIKSESDTMLNVAEQSANGTEIGYVFPTDPAVEDNEFTYSLTDDAGGRFAIHPVSGLLTVANSATLDHEVTTIHTITARVTDDTGDSYEQQLQIALDAVNETPEIRELGGTTPVYLLNDVPVVLDSNVTLTDPELGSANNYNNALLTIARQGGANAHDQFHASGTLVQLTEGQPLLVSGSGTVGTVVKNSAGMLSIRFDNNASQAIVHSVARSIAYSNTGAPVASQSISLNWTFDDNNTGNQGSNPAIEVSETSTVLVTPLLLDAIDDNFGPVLSGTSQTISANDLLGNDINILGNSVSITSVSEPTTGTLTDNTDGTYSFGSAVGETGISSFDYAIQSEDTRIHPATQHLWALTDNASDSIGGNDGTLHGPTVGADGLHFDGNNDFISIPSIEYKDNFSISFDFRLNSFSESSINYIFEHGPQYNNHSLLISLNTAHNLLGLHTATIQTYLKDDDDINLGFIGYIDEIISFEDDGKWHRYTLTVEPGVGNRIYIDGVLQPHNIVRGDTHFDPTGTAYIGSNDGNSGFLSSDIANIANFQIYNTTLPADETDTPEPLTSTGTANITLRNEEQLQANNALPANEGELTTIGKSHLNTTDSDSSDSASDIVYTLTSVPNHGTLSVAGSVLSMAQTFTQQSIDDGDLKYQHNGSDPVAADSFGFSVDDGVGTSTSATFSINVANVNDSPEIINNNAILVSEGSQSTNITSAILRTTDSDDIAADLVYTVTSAPSHGHLAFVEAPDTPILSFTQEFIDTGRVIYRNNGDNTTSDSFSFSVADGGEAPATPANGNFTINIVPVNDAPTFNTSTGTSSLTNHPVYVLGAGAVVLEPDLLISDEELDSVNDYSGSQLQLSRSGTANSNDVFVATGDLSPLTESATLSYDGAIIGVVSQNSVGSLVLDFTNGATAEQINQAIRSIAYQFTGTTASTTITLDWRFNDGNTDPAGTGISLDTTGSTELNLLRIPNLTVSGPPTLTLNEDSDLVLVAENAIVTQHDMSADAPLRLEIEVEQGTLALNDLTGLSVISGGQNTGRIVVDGHHSDIAAALSSGLTFSPATDFTGTTAVTATLSTSAGLLGHYEFNTDGTDSSAGTAHDATLNGATILTTDPERATVATFTNSGDNASIAGTLNEPNHLTLAAWVNLDAADANGAAVISIGNTATLQLDSANGVTGTARINGTAAQVSTDVFVESSGWRHVAFSIDTTLGTLSVYIDGALAGQTAQAGTLDYQSGENTALGSGAGAQNGLNFSGSLDDARIYNRALSAEEIATLAGNRAQASYTFNLDISAINDAPINNGTIPARVSVLEDTATAIDLSAMVLADVDAGSDNLRLSVSTDPLNTLNVNTTTGLTVNGNGTHSIELGGTLTDLNNWLSNPTGLVFQAANNLNGIAAAAISLSINDLGHSGTGGALTTALGSVIVDITGVNDAPTGGDLIIITDEDTAVAIRAAHFAFQDSDGHSLDAVQISTLPSQGMLTLTGTPVTALQEISRAALDASQLLFTPAPDAHGDLLDSFTFRVIDTGGTDQGGTDTATTPSTLRFQVAPVNDPPSSANATITLAEDDSFTFDSSHFAFNDSADADAFSGITIRGLPANGELLNNALAVSTNDTISTSDLNNGQLTYIPAANAHGTSYARFDFTVQDDGSNSDGTSASSVDANTITIDVTAVNDAPALITNNGVQIDESATSVTIDSTMLAAQDIDNSPADVVYTVSSNPQHGFLELSSAVGIAATTFSQDDIDNNRLSYQFSGTAATTDGFEFTLSDDGVNQSVKTVFSISISSLNDAPSFSTSSAFTSLADDIGSVLIRDAATQADGKTIVVGSVSSDPAAALATFDFIVGRFNTDGSIDTTFASNGLSTLDIQGAQDDALSVLLRPDGRIVIAGSSWNTTNGYDITVVQLNPDGSLDANFPIALYKYLPNANEYATHLALQPDGKVLVGGVANLGQDANQNLAFIRLNDNGSPDTTFNSDGFQQLNHNNSRNLLTGLGVQSDGSIVASAGIANQIIRLDSSGSPDGSFANAGVADIASSAQDLQILADDSILVAGSLNDNAWLARLLPDGSPDLSFGTAGNVEADFGGIERILNVDVQSDGKILLTGELESTTDVRAITARFTADGQLDPTFGSNGFVTSVHAVEPITNRNFFALTLAPDDSFKIVVVTESGGQMRSEIHSYGANGNLDYRYNPATTSNTLDANPAITEGDAAIILDSNVQVIDQELSHLNDFSGASLLINRSGSSHSDDVFSASGLLQPLTEGQPLVFDGDTIGTVTSNTAGELGLLFSNGASNEQVNGALQAISYQNTSQNPQPTVVLDWVFNDGNTGSQGTADQLLANGSITIDITPVNQAPTIVENSALTLTAGDTGHQLTAANLRTDDIDNSTAELSYTVTDLSDNIQISLADTVLSVGGSFSQSDIDSGLVTVDHNGALLPSESFNFSVSDGTESRSGTFTISVDNEIPHDLASGIQLNLDGGNSSYLLDQSHYNFINGLSEVTWEFAFSDLQRKPTGFSTLYSAASGNTHTEYLAIHPDGQVEWFINSLPGNGILSGTSYVDPDIDFPDLFDGSLHNIAITLDLAGGNESIRLFVDGKLANTGDLPALNTSASGDFPWLIGQHQTAELVFEPDNAFAGTIHDVRIWDVARTEQQIDDNRHARFDARTLPANLLVNWQMTTLNGNGTVANVTGSTGANALPVTLAAQQATGPGYQPSTPTDSLSLPDDASNGYVIGHLTPLDSVPDVGGYSYSLTDNANGAFAIDSTTGALTVNDSTQLNFTAQQSHFITVQVVGSDTPTRTNSQVIEFAIESVNEAPQIQSIIGAATASEQTTSTALEPNLVIVDEELSTADNFNASLLQLQRVGASNSDDSFHASGNLTALIEGDTLQYNGTPVGLVSNNSNGLLQLVFDSNADNDIVNQVARSIAYQNTSDTPPGSLQLQWLFSDNNAGVQGSGGPLTSVATTEVTLAAINDAPVITGLDATVNYTENSPAVRLDTNVSISDAELSNTGNYDGARLTITRDGASSGEDQFGASGLLGTLTKGEAFSYNGSNAGMVLENGDGRLTLTFDNIAASDVAGIVRSITYLNSSENPPANVLLNWQFSDQNSGAQGSGGAPPPPAPPCTNQCIKRRTNAAESGEQRPQLQRRRSTNRSHLGAADRRPRR